MSRITQAQQDALERIYKDLYEHFEGGVVAVVATIETDTDVTEEAFRCYWAGGRIQAIGLAAEAMRGMQEQEHVADDEEDVEE